MMFLEKVKRLLQTVWWLLAVAKVVTAGISCLSSPCLHGICIDDVNTTYSCYCVDGYTGVQCQTNWDECWSNPCQNGGTCIDGIASYNCSCPDGFIGDNCETNYNECESNPCLNNGTCIDMNNGYLCSCIPGFSGDHCELDVAVCNSTEEVRCYNGGQCIEGPGFKFYCKCLPGWAGPKCEDQIDECESNPCQNGGVCIDVHADYMCACAFGFTGKSCEVQIEFCDENSCSNNALCVVEDGARVCYCVPDYHGERCELQYDECLLGPRCMNGGTCIDGVDNFTCSCPPRLTGPLCECLILDDESYDCEYVSPTPPTSSTQSVLTTLIDEITTPRVYTEMSSTYSPNDTTILTTDSEAVSTTVTDTSTEKEPVFTATTIITEITTKEDAISSTSEETTVTSESTTTKAGISELPDHEETRPTIESDNAKTDTTTDDAVSTSSSPTDFTFSSTGSTKFDMPIETTKDITEDGTITSSGTTHSSTEEVTVPGEITTTPKVDVSTDQMFTDIPTDRPGTEQPTGFSSTTEAVEVSSGTVSSGSTEIVTTVQSECTDSICNGHGSCINTPHGIRCHCNFNYGGRFCDEAITITSAAFGGNSFIAHKLANATSINIEFNAKTLITDGQILHADIAKGVYMQLYMNSGLLKFKFSCGYQTMLLSELKTFVNKGYPMKIETRLDLYPEDQHCNATLRLNDTVAMSGGQVANITTLDHNSTLYLGNSRDIKDSESKPFIGCIRDLIVNGEKREVFGDALDAGEVTECLSLSCLSGPCLNGGTCSDHHDGGYTCSCANGWLGEHCNESVCENNPCQSGGSCVRHPGSGFLCLCPYGKHGILCEYNVEITRPALAPISTGISSYIMYALSPAAMNSDRFDLRLRFQTSDMDQIALLAFIGQSGRHDSRSQHLALTFVKGYIMLTWNMGSGPRRVFTSRALSPRRGGHAVRVWRRGRSAGLSVDGRHNISGNAPAHSTKMTLLPYIFIGGHPSPDFVDLPHDLPLHSGWRGCIWEVGGQAIGAGARAAGGRGVGQCGVAQCTAKSCNAPRGVCIHSPATYGCICNEGWFGATCSSTRNPCDRAHSKCQGQCVITTDGNTQCDCPYGKTGVYCDQDLIPTDVLFTGTRSYLQLHPTTISSVSLSLESEIKPAKERGLVMFVKTPHFYTALSLQGGLLEYRWTDRLSGVTSLVRSGVVVSMSQWHSVKAGRYGSRLYVWVDGSLSTEAMLAHAYPHTNGNASILLGGAKDLSTLPFDAMSGAPAPYTGCIKNFHVNNILLPLEQQNIQEGRNLADCDGTACGDEACGGGVCILEQGRARCSCGASSNYIGTGPRCRRHVSCQPSTCAPPRGRCRADRCICSAGYAGTFCDQKIDIKIPQFDGTSLVSLGRQSAMVHTNQQRIAPTLTRPSYVALNFTTAEPNGLLVWIEMGNDYIGLGLENGYAKLVWSFNHNSVKTAKSGYGDLVGSPRTLTRLMPHAGYLSDGEWHILVLQINETNITLTADNTLVYTEEPGLNIEAEYDDIDMFIGGISDHDYEKAKKVFPNNFKGCIDQISTREKSFITNYTEVYSENVKSCQLYPPT
ncbi:unnamed protein product [Spodoptera littoralis]|uniref:Protein eyes shut n=1 Tax=Spodoptera littoralis TaxID=7109 RepID=A0A9P0IHA0_SPOLI|nr:unnamed protein product [Spodoptera littoralis]CAH1645076.1 unnamed protein product [Spodoptera littoralis]